MIDLGAEIEQILQTTSYNLNILKHEFGEIEKSFYFKMYEIQNEEEFKNTGKKK